MTLATAGVATLKISVLTVNFNTETHIQKALESLRAQSLPAEQFEVILINNKQNDKLRQAIDPAHYPFAIHFIDSPENVGFGRANNLGAAQARGEYLLVMNPDITLEQPQYLQSLYDCAKAHPNYGALATPHLTHGKLRPSANYEYEFSHNYTGKSGICWLSGAIMLIPRAVYSQVGGFDPDFFMYSEDVDIGLRIRAAGYDLFEMNSLYATHEGGSSEPYKDYAYFQRWYRSRFLFCHKHYPAAIYQEILQDHLRDARRKQPLYRWGRHVLPRWREKWNKWQAVVDCIQEREPQLLAQTSTS